MAEKNRAARGDGRKRNNQQRDFRDYSMARRRDEEVRVD